MHKEKRLTLLKMPKQIPESQEWEKSKNEITSLEKNLATTLQEE